MREIASVVVLLCAVSLHAATFTVSSSLDSGPGTLRQAIVDANVDPDRDQIVFTTPTVVITGESLRYIDYPVDIDGTVGIGRVDIQGTAEVGLFFHSLIAPGAATSTVKNLMIRGFGMPFGILAHDMVVTNCAFDNKVWVRGNNNTLRDSTFEDFEIGNGTNTVLERSVITGTVLVRDAVNAHIGTAGNGNTIGPGSADANAALQVIEVGFITIEGNDIHSDRPAAIHLHDAAEGALVTGNTIHDAPVGILVGGTPASGFVGARILGNSIRNVALPIDLETFTGFDGATPNDPAPDADGGGNRLQNFPVLASAVATPGSLTVTGTLISAPSTDYLVELFSNPTSDPGEAQTSLLTFTVTTDAAGNATFTRTLPTSADDTAITATATNQTTNDTSEVSAPIVVDPSGQLSFHPTAYNVNEGDGTITITVVRTGGNANSVTVNYATNDGTAISPTDFAAASGTLTFGPGVTSQTIAVPIVSDPVGEPAETFTVTLSNPTNGATIGEATANVTIAAAAGVAGVPTLSEWALIALAIGLLAAAVVRV